MNPLHGAVLSGSVHGRKQWTVLCLAGTRISAHHNLGDRLRAGAHMLLRCGDPPPHCSAAESIVAGSLSMCVSTPCDLRNLAQDLPSSKQTSRALSSGGFRPAPGAAPRAAARRDCPPAAMPAHVVARATARTVEVLSAPRLRGTVWITTSASAARDCHRLGGRTHQLGPAR